MVALIKSRPDLPHSWLSHDPPLHWSGPYTNGKNNNPTRVDKRCNLNYVDYRTTSEGPMSTEHAHRGLAGSGMKGSLGLPGLGAHPLNPSWRFWQPLSFHPV